MVDQETVFRGKTEPLTDERAKLLMMLLIAEQGGGGAEQNNDPISLRAWFLPQLIEKRVDVLKLPIKFTRNAIFSVNAFTGVPGGAVIFLIDALTRYEGKTVTLEDIVALYPNGFYTEEAMTDYIDNYLKPRKVKWSEIY